LLFTDKKEIYDASNLYLNIVAPFYAFFALGLGLYFVSQAFNTLIWPVMGTLIRLTFVVLISQILFRFDLASPTNIFIIMSVGMMIYGVFISLTLYFGSWKKMINI
jgi:Na+-driven multidrug efflux pump